MRTIALRGAVGVAAASAAALAAAPAATASPTPGPEHSAAYLAAQLAAGEDHLSVESGGSTYPDIGLTIDAVLAMQATGTAGEQAAASAEYVMSNAGGYTGADYGDLYAGAAGKLLVLTASRGASPTVGGVDYLAGLQDLEDESGQFTDSSGYGDYSNTLSQSFSLIGLKRNGVNPSTAAVDFLLSRQCDDGGFALANSGECASDPDATSVAVQALAAVGGQSAAIGEAAEYLGTQQGSSGGVKGGPSTRDENANSTGLAAVAFRLAGQTSALTSARGWLDSVRLGCDSPQVTGALAYTRAAAGEAGASTEPTDELNRSTAQALLGSTEVSYVDVTSAGSQAAPAELDCSDEPTTDGTDEPTTDDTGSDAPDTSEPLTGPVVETDLPAGSTSGAPAAGVALAALLGTVALVGLIRRAGS